jgi:hypothetical protein
MNAQKSDNKELYYRLIALWVVCEAFAGGIMHAVKIPFAGMFVSGLAVLCIILIGYYLPSKSAILKATVIVAVFKLLLSPQSPPTAYIAVFFQGLVGQMLFYNKKPFTLTAIILAVLSLAESALQRLLVLVIIYGSKFWHAVDEFVKKTIGGKDRHYSMMLAEGYIIIHVIVGIFLGIFALRLVKRSVKWRSNHPELLIQYAGQSQTIPVKAKKKKINRFFILLWLLLLFIFVQAYVEPAHAILPANEAAQILLRSVLIVLSWWLIVSPLLLRFIKSRLRTQQEEKASVINKVMQLLPETKYIFTQGWVLSSGEKGFARMKLFLKILLVNIL